ncbi:DUF2202 domain-containing protein [Siansivirga zeaxanthinifaciens]|nr:DUF2202 domain-containing protein [Siansivirga zeaxanthinifaciens]
MIALSISLSFMYACDSKNDDEINTEIADISLKQTDKDALLFMMEEEKLARDTYRYLDNLWSITQFANIKGSEQTHMNAIETLLKQYNVTYEILPEGKFANEELQNFYNNFISSGAISIANALQIGATIEDLDIVDLQRNIEATNNKAIISVFEKLQCGSRNHLRSFLNGIESNGDTYTPQFLSLETYNSIINSPNEKCGKN